ncbi:hypothetical protein B7463_g3041, partial [Scytalidium lignicola]
MAQKLTLPDGRIAEYLVSGDTNGFPLVWIHGTPGAYQPVPSLVAASEKKGVKVITISRAGYGSSSRNKGRSVVDAVADIQAVNEHLGVQRCLVGGWSGGGPHALACAARLPGCVAALSVAGVGPYNVEGLDFLKGQGEDNVEEFNAALKGEEELQKYCRAQREQLLQMDLAGITTALDSLFPEVDKKALATNGAMGQYIGEGFHEALRVSADGWVDDDLAFTKPWGFELSEIKVPVFLYQGTEDKMVPYAHGEWLAKQLPQDKVKKHLLPSEGHMSIFLGQEDLMIDELLEIAKL